MMKIRDRLVSHFQIVGHNGHLFWVVEAVDHVHAVLNMLDKLKKIR